MIPDNDTLQATCLNILPTSIHGVTRHDTAPRPTPVWGIPNVCAILRRRPSTNPTCAHGYQVMSSVCRAHTVSRLKHEALNQCWPNMGPASQTVCQHWNNIASGHNIT